MGAPGTATGAADGAGLWPLSPSSIIASLKASKSTEPSPVTGSQPGMAEYPCPQQTRALAAQLLVPSVMSLAKAADS